METIELPESWNEWSITEKIGQGAFGTVYKAEKIIGNETFVSAIKIIRVPGNASEVDAIGREIGSEASVRAYFRDIVDSYIAEIKTMDALKGISNIVSVEDYIVEEVPDEIAWRIYIRMEFLQSFPKYSMAKKIDEQEAIRLGIDLCTALGYCEKMHILHRDIKPDNIFVSQMGHFKLGDFGVARQADKLTATYSTKGTFTYMAPEVFKGYQYGQRADIYSLGILLYRLMNRNRDPFVDPHKQIIYYKDRDSALRRRMNGEKLPSPLAASKAFSAVILKACAYDPEDRYESAGEMLKALQEIGQKEKAADTDGNTNSDIVSRKEIQKLVPVIFLLVGIAILAIVFFGVSFFHGSHDSRDGETESNAIKTVSEANSMLESETMPETQAVPETQAISETREQIGEQAAGNYVTADGNTVIDISGCASFVFWKNKDLDVWIVVSEKKIEDIINQSGIDIEIAKELAEKINKGHFAVDKESDLKVGDIVTLSFTADEDLRKTLEENHLQIKFQRISKAFEGWEQKLN